MRGLQVLCSVHGPRASTSQNMVGSSKLGGIGGIGVMDNNIDEGALVIDVKCVSTWTGSVVLIVLFVLCKVRSVRTERRST